MHESGGRKLRAGVAIFHKHLIRTRAAEGRNRAKAKGKATARLSERLKEATRRRAQGATLQELAHNYNVGISTIRRATRAPVNMPEKLVAFVLMPFETRFDDVYRLGIKGPRGWLRAIREALSMTTAQLAARLKVSQPRIVEMEKAEQRGAIRRDTLERAAQALGCTPVYALVPNGSLDEMVWERARKIAAERLSRGD